MIIVNILIDLSGGFGSSTWTNVGNSVPSGGQVEVPL